MVKKILAGVIGLPFLCFALAGRAENGYYERNFVISDTSDKKDTLTGEAVPASDPKKEFSEFSFTSYLPHGTVESQLNPQMISFVQGYIKQYGKKMEEMRDWGRPYFDMMDKILTQHDLPKELKYLAVIESYLKTNARSRTGAVGPWQFMPATAKNMGLRVSKKYDERKDFAKSTHAASKYLTNL